jgi:GNAT superfamily N-acetyltransferase
MLSVAPLDMRHHEERWASQLRQDAVYLLAWRGNRVVGRLTLPFRSRFPKVRFVLADVAEMNALEARPQGQGIGTALILAGEQEARRRAVPILGLAVEVQNHGARRLYERLATACGNTAWSSTDGRRATTRATSSESTPTSAFISRSPSADDHRRRALACR